jgi:hypothetical protein
VRRHRCARQCQGVRPHWWVPCSLLHVFALKTSGSALAVVIVTAIRPNSPRISSPVFLAATTRDPCPNTAATHKSNQKISRAAVPIIVMLTPPRTPSPCLQGNSVAVLGWAAISFRFRGFLSRTFEMSSCGLCSSEAGHKLTNSLGANKADQQPPPRLQQLQRSFSTPVAYLSYGARSSGLPPRCHHRTTAQRP